VRAVFGSASLVGNCVVFNIGGNKYRLVARVLYPSQKVFVLRVMTHEEYDDGAWQEHCGCFAPPPRGTKETRETAGKRQRKGR